MAVKRGENLNVSPGAGDKVLEGDRLVVIGKNESLESLKDYDDKKQ